jgi:hypothetical protein
MVTIGIDGGLTGAIAILGAERADVVDIPTMQLAGGTITKRIDARALVQLVKAHAKHPTTGFDGVLVCIEALATGGTGKGRGNAMTIGSQYRTRGSIEAAIDILGMPRVIEVTPQSWKKFYGLGGKEKRDSLALARDLYPELSQTHLKRAADHNRAEAVLIAHWARKCKA